MGWELGQVFDGIWFILIYFDFMSMGSWGQEKVPTTLQGFATWRRQVSGLEAATRHDVIRHGITLDMAARSWSSNYHRNIIEHWHWNHWSPEIFPFLAAASEEWFGMMLTGTQQDLKYFEIEWGSMMLHVGTHFFPDFDCRLQIVFSSACLGSVNVFSAC